jgi:uncharacterized membrane protein
MADLIVIEYDDTHKAEEVRLKLQKMQRELKSEKTRRYGR